MSKESPKSNITISGPTHFEHHDLHDGGEFGIIDFATSDGVTITVRETIIQGRINRHISSTGPFDMNIFNEFIEQHKKQKHQFDQALRQYRDIRSLHHFDDFDE